MPNYSTQRILEERARVLARPTEAPRATQAELELVAFHLAGEHLAVPTASVRETQPLRAHRWSRVPCTPGFIVGVVNLRGHVYSITDLAQFWGLPARPLANEAHLLLVRGGLTETGRELELTLLTDDVPHVMRLDPANLHATPATLSTEMLEVVRGVTTELLMVLDLERLLSDPRLIVQDAG